MMKLIFILITGFVFAQGHHDIGIRKEVEDIYHLPFKNADEVIIAGKKILTISKNDSEASKGYYRLFMGYYLKGDFSKTIFYAKKADALFLKHQRVGDHFMATYYLALSYQKTGFMSQAYQKLKEAEEIARKLNASDFTAMTFRIRANFLENQKKYKEAIEYRIKSNSYSALHSLKDKRFLLAVCEFRAGRCYLAFNYLMTGNIQEAKKQIALYEAFKKETAYYNYRIEIYYACKAIIAEKENKRKEAADYFDKAIKAARESEAYDQLGLLMELRLKLNIDNTEKRQQLFSEFIQLKERSKEEDVKVISQEIKSNNLKLQRQKKYKYIIIFAGLMLSAGLVVYKRRKRNQQKRYFEDIISELENNKKMSSAVDKTAIVEKKSFTHDSREMKQQFLTNETKEELLKKLLDFENGKAFTAKSFTLNNFASIMDTNTKYLNCLLKEHRGKNFSEYINDLRIKYILEYLHENPESLKYKLNHLSDLAGFSSHSYFTKIFTKSTKITPSKFISALKEKNQKDI